MYVFAESARALLSSGEISDGDLEFNVCPSYVDRVGVVGDNVSAA